VRAACQLVREIGAAEELVETVCRAVLEAVRGHGGESTRWLPNATRATYELLEALARERADEPAWRWLSGQVSRW
jgi:hypothetical protein